MARAQGTPYQRGPQEGPLSPVGTLAPVPLPPPQATSLRLTFFEFVDTDNDRDCLKIISDIHPDLMMMMHNHPAKFIIN